MEEEAVIKLSVEECWELLESHEFGRLAYSLVDEVHIVPINYATHNGILYFRTAAGTKLFAAALKVEVAFEIDWYDEATAWSVVVRGRLRRLEEDEQGRVGPLSVRSWIATDKPEVIELLPDVVTGRRFVLQRAEPDTETLR